MAIKFPCPGCDKRLQAPEKLSGKSATCPQCGTRVTIPGAAATFDPAAFFADSEEPADAPRQVKDQPDTRRLTPPRSPPNQDHDSKNQDPSQQDGDFSNLDLSESEFPGSKPQRRRRKSGGDSPESDADRGTRNQDPEEDLLTFVKPRKKKVKVDKLEKSSDPRENLASSDEISPLRQNLYWFLLLSLIPLCVSIFGGSDDIRARLESTLQAHPELIPMMDQEVSRDEFLARLPDHKLIGAFLSRDSWMHWVFALFSAIGFMALITVLFRTRRAPPHELLWRGLVIGTIGIALLLTLQTIAQFSMGVGFRRGHVVVLLVIYFLKFIAFSYYCATNPENGFFLSFIGFTCGVGMCEELCKAMLLLGHYRWSEKTAGWGTACAWGLACGAGFGVSEGIMYSGDQYNGLSGAHIYVVRFISCVALHAIWSGTVGILLYRCRELFRGDMDWSDVVNILIHSFIGVIVLHGLYDTFLKREMEILALVTALGSFAWLAYLIEQSRARTRKSGIQ